MMLGRLMMLAVVVVVEEEDLVLFCFRACHENKTKTAFFLRLIKFAQFPFGVSSSKQT
jgi:hypothetical protein